MTIVVNVWRAGKSLCVTLPTEVTEKLGVRDGDKLYLMGTSEGYSLTLHDPEFMRAMEIARRGMRRYWNALRKLAES